MYSARYIDAPVLLDAYTLNSYYYSGGEGGVGAGYYYYYTSSRLYYLNDANYNVTSLIDNSGGAVERYAYDAHGKVTDVQRQLVEYA